MNWCARCCRRPRSSAPQGSRDARSLPGLAMDVYSDAFRSTRRNIDGGASRPTTSSNCRSSPPPTPGRQPPTQRCSATCRRYRPENAAEPAARAATEPMASAGASVAVRVSTGLAAEYMHPSKPSSPRAPETLRSLAKDQALGDTVALGGDSGGQFGQWGTLPLDVGAASIGWPLGPYPPPTVFSLPGHRGRQAGTPRALITLGNTDSGPGRTSRSAAPSSRSHGC